MQVFSSILCSVSWSCLFVPGWTVAHQAPPSMGFPRQEYWSGLPFPSPGDLPNSGREPMSLASPALEDGFLTTSATWEALSRICAAFWCVGFFLRGGGVPFHSFIFEIS